jgi:hypothetical protein
MYYLGEIRDLHVTFNISKETEKYGFSVNRVKERTSKKDITNSIT